STDRIGRPRLRDSGRRIETEAKAPSSEQRIVTERPEERESPRWPIIVLSALVAGGVIILVAIKVKEYAEKSDGPPPATVVAAAEAPAAESPATAPASEPPSAAPAPAAPASEPPAATPNPAATQAPEPPVTPPAPTPTQRPEPPAAAPASDPP